MSWDAWVASLTGSGAVQDAAIIGNDGTIWAQSAGLGLRPDEAEKVTKGMRVPSRPLDDVYFWFGGEAVKDLSLTLADLGIGAEAKVQLGPSATRLRGGVAGESDKAGMLVYVTQGENTVTVEVAADATVQQLATAAVAQFVSAGVPLPADPKEFQGVDFRSQGLYINECMFVCLRYDSEEGTMYGVQPGRCSSYMCPDATRHGVSIASSNKCLILARYTETDLVGGRANLAVRWLRQQLMVAGF
eukprot:TRINITY_DN4655_c0_g2_i2.p1 TRINITY_DN4655_c0_g2~~TRINITY_DN4655_c0_g2_i2.p1  ORF type:complete len:286 (+),score=78.44 TRINITY_DN4655_c0_g2_i2:125-859(+)